MDEIDILRDSFEPGVVPSDETRQRARTALQSRIDGVPATVERGWTWRLTLPIGLSVATAAAIVAAVTVHVPGRPAPVAPEVVQQEEVVAAQPYLKPVSAKQYLENAAWTVERKQWTDPAPTEFMYVETQELRNPRSLENQKPNGALAPDKAKYRTVQRWDRVDGQVWAYKQDGELVVRHLGDGVTWGRLPWSTIAKMTTPQAVRAYVADPGGPLSVDVDALGGQYVLPPAVQAAVFRYLAEQPGMTVTTDATNLDGRPAIGLGRVIEGYLSQELLFDKQTYALIGERLVAIADHVGHALDGTTHTKKGALFRQVMYRKLIIVNKPGATTAR